MRFTLALFSLATLIALGSGCQTRESSPSARSTTAIVPAVTPMAAPIAPAARTYLFGWGDVSLNIAHPRGGSSRGAPVTRAADRTLPLAEIAAAGTAYEKDRAAILSLAGDYKVSFHFMETIGLTPDYQPKAPYHSWATEHVRVIEDTGRFISLQHILVMFFKKEDGTISEPMVMKHWRQDWTYEDTDLHTFRGKNTWARKTLTAAEAKGTWAQAVFQVDDSPRYESYGRWEHTGNVSAWTGSKEFRPLPRREHTVRKDYEVMEGAHRIVLTPTGWPHEQQNWKRVAGEDSEPRYVAQELGLDRYDLITAPGLEAADVYWEKTGAYWSAVRRAWADTLAKHDRFTFRADVAGKKLFEIHFAYADKLTSGQAYDPIDGERHARTSIESFIE